MREKKKLFYFIYPIHCLAATNIENHGPVPFQVFD